MFSFGEMEVAHCACHDIDREIDESTAAFHKKSDGRYPLVSNDHSLSSARLLAAHERQPVIGKRF